MPLLKCSKTDNTPNCVVHHLTPTTFILPTATKHDTDRESKIPTPIKKLKTISPASKIVMTPDLDHSQRKRIPPQRYSPSELAILSYSQPTPVRRVLPSAALLHLRHRGSEEGDHSVKVLGTTPNLIASEESAIPDVPGAATVLVNKLHTDPNTIVWDAVANAYHMESMLFQPAFTSIGPPSPHSIWQQLHG